MTINSTIRKAGPFIGNGTASAFPFTFKVFQAADLDVVRLDQSTNVETTLVLTSDYTVTLNQDQDSNPGGTVTLVAGALASGFTLTMTSDVPNLQPTDLTNQGGFYPEVINDALDRATIQIQQLQEQTDRSFKVALSSNVDATLPPPAPNDLIGWDAAGEALINVDPTSLATVVAYATAYCDVFVGNGITTSWTLTRNPAVLYNLDVSINGSSQEPTRDYTLSGTTFTMTTPPPIGARVVVKYKEGLPNYEGDSQDVRFVPAGAGAVTRSVQSRLRETVSVKDFGAVGDGITNDYAAIAAAIATGNNVDFPKAIYKCSGSLVMSHDGQALRLNGSHLIVDGIELDADNVTIDLGGGIIDQNCRWAKVAVVPAPQATSITVDDASRLVVGQNFVSSWGNDVDQWPLGGPSDPTPHTITSINGNVVTMNKPMYGTTMTVPIDLNVGDFGWGTLLSLKSGSALFLNGTVQRAIGYYGITPSSGASGASITFRDMNFASNGLDQFLIGNSQYWSFYNCNIAKNLDVGKSGFYFTGSAYLLMDGCDAVLGNFDPSFQISDFGNTYTGGEIIISNCKISGKTELDTSYGYYSSNALHAFCLQYNGSFDRIVISNSEFVSYSRHFFSSTVVATSKQTGLGLLAISNTSINSPFAYFLSSGSGQFFVCSNATLDAVSFYVDSTHDGQIFCYADAVSGAGAMFKPNFSNCYFKLTYDSAKIQTKSIISNSHYNATPILISTDSAYYDKCYMTNTSSLVISPGYSSEFYGHFGEFIIDDPDFPQNPSGVFSLFGGSTASGAVFGKAKSENGSFWYDIYKVGSTVSASTEAKIVNGTYFLRGDDYCITTGSRIQDVHAGTTSKVTFHYLPTLTTTASAGATSIVISDNTGILAGDKVNIVLDNGLVDTRTVDVSYGGTGLTIPLTSALSATASSGNRTCFFRVV